MTFKFDNYSVLYNKTGLAGNNPSTYNLGASDFADIKTLGLLSNESFYKVEPKEVIIDSLGEEVVLSYQLEAELKIENELSEAKLLDIDSELISLVLAPKTVVIADAAEDLSYSGNEIATGEKLLILKPATAKLFINKKLGSSEINPTVIKLTTIANTKAELIKEFNVIIP